MVTLQATRRTYHKTHGKTSGKNISCMWPCNSHLIVVPSHAYQRRNFEIKFPCTAIAKTKFP